ncbi:inhibitor of apoptosis repeat-containing protein [Lophiostoma macrostomum CBS 122681]|uniref:Inhibitor of apoptosis repeat-containing protein n=1 Tax=Lophiostoma macrostomum CBS 122681 TaxID=1314788 RepID=A0A6A6SMA0_9PLEO|nr:inhibitor of apoptosis repeat-containing protein [Lophiostoma macrostomum CBS 122681]
MKPSIACLQSRLDTFGSSSNRRRTSSRSKKIHSSWPLQSPPAYDLAYAGFIWKPTSASPDNVQCFHCGCQLDGWEPTDNPSFEHLTHSPECAFAINAGIRYRHGDPQRAEENPLSDKMRAARSQTYGDMWPLNSDDGFPSVEQMVDAGFFYDPGVDAPDGATCPYCSMSLDAWDAGDDPLEEHRRREDSCLFFALKELYYPTSVPHTEDTIVVETAKPGKKGKRSSKAATTGTGRTTRQSVGVEAMEYSHMEEQSLISQPASKKATTSKALKGKRTKRVVSSDVESEPNHNKPLPAIPIEDSIMRDESPDLAPTATASRNATKVAGKATGRGWKASKTTKRDSNASIISASTRQTRRNKVAADDSIISVGPSATRPTRGQKRISDAPSIQPEIESDIEPIIDSFPQPVKSQKTVTQSNVGRAVLLTSTLDTRSKKRTSDEAELLPQPARPVRGKKRVSEESDLQPANKRSKRISDNSNAPPIDHIASPNTNVDSNPQAADRFDWPTFSLPESAIASTPKQEPARPMDWISTDVETFFEDFKNEMMATSLTAAEKQMTIREYLVHNSKVAEEVLRANCARQIELLDKEGKRALETLAAIPVAE